MSFDDSVPSDLYDGYETCPTCGGAGTWERHEPKADDPDFCVMVDCQTCNGSGLSQR